MPSAINRTFFAYCCAVKPLQLKSSQHCKHARTPTRRAPGQLSCRGGAAVPTGQPHTPGPRLLARGPPTHTHMTAVRDTTPAMPNKYCQSGKQQRSRPTAAAAGRPRLGGKAHVQNRSPHYRRTTLKRLYVRSDRGHTNCTTTGSPGVDDTMHDHSLGYITSKPWAVLTYVENVMSDIDDAVVDRFRVPPSNDRYEIVSPAQPCSCCCRFHRMYRL